MSVEAGNKAWWVRTIHLLAQTTFQDSRQLGWRSAVQAVYTSMVVYWVVQVVTVVSKERAGLLHRGSGRDDCRGPETITGLRPQLRLGTAWLSASPWLWMLDEPLQRDICRRDMFRMFSTTSCDVTYCQAFPGDCLQVPEITSNMWNRSAVQLKPDLTANLALPLRWFTYVVLLFAGDRVAADLSVLNGWKVPGNGKQET